MKVGGRLCVCVCRGGRGGGAWGVVVAWEGCVCVAGGGGGGGRESSRGGCVNMYV